MVDFTFDGQNLNPNSNPIVANNAELYALTFSHDDGLFGFDDQDDTVTIVNVTDPNNPVTEFTDVSFTYIGNGVFPPNAQPPELAGREVAVVDVLNASGNVVDSFFFFVDGGQTPPLGNGNTRLRRSDLDPNPTPICFVEGTLINTPDGPQAIEDIRVGDYVMTSTGPSKVLFAASRKVEALEQFLSPGSRRVIVSRGALGANLPTRDLSISQQHRVLVRGENVATQFGVDQALAPVKGLVDGERIRIATDATTFTYHHIALDRHAIILAEGASVETLFLGDQTEQLLSGPDWDALKAALV